MKFKSLWSTAVIFASLGLRLDATAQPGPPAIPGQTITVLRSTELRSDKLSSAPVLDRLAMGAVLRLVGVEGGWAFVESSAIAGNRDAKISGWVRASAVNWQSGSSTVSGLASGREAAGNTALTLGVRSLPPRINRHALIIGLSRYADPAIPPLPGVQTDKQSATQMAEAMQVPPSNISYLQDEQATANSIRRTIQELTDKVQDGDRVFIYFSGYGTSYNDRAAAGCIQALYAYDGGVISNNEMTDALKAITMKADKLLVLYDASYSGGNVPAASAVRTRGTTNANDEGALRPKYVSTSEGCDRTVNAKTHNFLAEAIARGALPLDIVHFSASRDNEVSLDDELKGGIATQFMRDCMLRDAKDLDNSGAISMHEIRQCAQEKINKRMANDANYKAQNLELSGNAAFVPAWFRLPNPSALVFTLQVPAVVINATPVPVPLTGEQALRQMFDQRDAKRQVQVTLAKDKLKINADSIKFSIQSDRTGFVYVALAGSDNKSLYLLFPNDLDQNNKLEAGRQLVLPRPNWRVAAAGPVGTDSLLVLVTDSQRDLAPLSASKAGPFLASLNDSQGRAKLGALMTTSASMSSQDCSNAFSRPSGALCSDAYGASMVTLQETN